MDRDYTECTRDRGKDDRIISYYQGYTDKGFGDLGLAQCTESCKYKLTSETGVGGPVTCTFKDAHNVKWEKDSSGEFAAITSILASQI